MGTDPPAGGGGSLAFPRSLRASRARKERLRALLLRGPPEGVVEMVDGSRLILATLLSLTYDPVPLVAWRAIEASGVAAAGLASADAGGVREHLRRLFWLLTEESGGMGWRAPETMAAVVARCGDGFLEYAPIVVHLLSEMAEEDLEHFRPGVLWAIGRLGRLADPDVDAVLPAIEASLDHPDATVRGTAAWCLGRVGRTGALAARPALRDDAGPLGLFEEGDLRPTTVGRIVAAALGTASAEPATPGGPGHG